MRYSHDAVVSHGGLSRPCYTATTLQGFKDSLDPDVWESARVIGIDEAQFFPDLEKFVKAAVRIALSDFPRGLSSLFLCPTLSPFRPFLTRPGRR